ncbi:hypothetical protein HanRHA438_Chr16g0764551 [Helianthus annuus]|nr:hypothetical protein HanIR_Chr16g0817921 [Helianthus annuus]KAJ0836224.1 hypothetical protein HanRHA438_Chr16g0764551 [Helianthus annuus]
MVSNPPRFLLSLFPFWLFRSPNFSLHHPVEILLLMNMSSSSLASSSSLSVTTFSFNGGSFPLKKTSSAEFDEKVGIENSKSEDTGASV